MAARLMKILRSIQSPGQLGLIAFALAGLQLQAGDFRPLPPPRTDGGKPLMQSLKERRTTREFATTPIPDALLSDLLWAGFGINRPGTGHRTAPSAMNQQEIDIYVATSAGVFLFDAKENGLRPGVTNDVRALTGALPGSTNAPVSLIFVADRARMEKSKGPEGEFYAAFDAGCVSQNVYLFCASVGLGTVVHEIGDRSKLAQAMGLRSDQRVILAQTVGSPKTP